MSAPAGSIKRGAPRFRLWGLGEHEPKSAAHSSSFAEYYLKTAHNHPMECLHAPEPAARCLPLQCASYQKNNTPSPLYPPGGVVSALRNHADYSESITYKTCSSLR